MRHVPTEGLTPLQIYYRCVDQLHDMELNDELDSRTAEFVRERADHAWLKLTEPQRRRVQAYSARLIREAEHERQERIARLAVEADEADEAKEERPRLFYLAGVWGGPYLVCPKNRLDLESTERLRESIVDAFKEGTEVILLPHDVGLFQLQRDQWKPIVSAPIEMPYEQFMESYVNGNDG